LTKLIQKQQVRAFLLALMALAIIYYQWILSPEWNSLRQLQQQIRTTKTTLKKKQDLYQQTRIYRQRSDALRKKYFAILEQLDQANAPTVVEQAQQKMQTLGLQLQRIQLSEQSPMQVSIEASGDFMPVFNFIAWLDQYSAAINVTEITIKTGKGNAHVKTGLVLHCIFSLPNQRKR